MKETEPNHSLPPDDDHASDHVAPASVNQPRLKCSYCGTVFYKNESRFVPFCSKKCQQIDLGMWLNESYGLPIEGSEGEFSQDGDNELD